MSPGGAVTTRRRGSFYGGEPMPRTPPPDAPMSRIPLAALALLLAACGAPTPSQPAAPPSLLAVNAPGGTTRLDPAEILQARIEGDVLLLEVRYGGGCETHDFALLHSGVFMESLPVQTVLTLAHDAHGDPCRALVGRSLRFDLTPVKRAYQAAYGEGGTLVLHLHAPGGAGAPAHSLRYEL